MTVRDGPESALKRPSLGRVAAYARGGHRRLQINVVSLGRVEIPRVKERPRQLIVPCDVSYAEIPEVAASIKSTSAEPLAPDRSTSVSRHMLHAAMNRARLRENVGFRSPRDMSEQLAVRHGPRADVHYCEFDGTSDACSHTNAAIARTEIGDDLLLADRVRGLGHPANDQM
jgi:hypothetical protein